MFLVSDAVGVFPDNNVDSVANVLISCTTAAYDEHRVTNINLKLQQDTAKSIVEKGLSFLANCSDATIDSCSIEKLYLDLRRGGFTLRNPLGFRRVSSNPCIAVLKRDHLPGLKAYVKANGCECLATTKNEFTGISLLHHATREGDSDCVAYLLENGANVNCTSNNGSTPLHYACHEGYPFIARQLLDAGAQLNNRMYNGETCLHQTSRYGRYDCIQVILTKCDPKKESMRA